MKMPDPSKLNLIKIIKNFIDKDDADKVIKHIDSNLEKFYLDERSLNGNRYSYRFGKDNVHPDSRPYLDELSDIKDIVEKYNKKILLTTQKEFNDYRDLFLSSFWLAKQEAGADLTYHKDVDDGYNMQYVYSAVLYLNTIASEGSLKFPVLRYEYMPQAYDLIIFPADGIEFYHGVDRVGEDRYSVPMWMTHDKNFELGFMP
jgi:hypothetical protein